MRSFTRGFLMMGALVLPALAEFVPPAEGPVPFRRDKLPVDVDTMTGLSRQLTVLARTSAAEGHSLRGVAQMTALALALDPENREARELIDALKEDKRPQAEAPEEAERARNRSWQALAWLEMPEAGADGQALAACLGDVLVVSDPKHPKARDRRSDGEKGLWKSWVADESAFRPKDPDPGPEMTEDEEEDEPETGPTESDKEFALRELSTPMPVWYFDRESKRMKLDLVPVKLRVRTPDPDQEDDEDEDDGDGKESPPESRGLVIEVPGEGMTERFVKAMKPVEVAMTARHGSFPAGEELKLDLGRIDYSMSRNGHALTATTALLIEGAYTGKVPAATVLAVVDENGKLTLPPRFWQTLRAMSALSPGTRLVLPEEAADFLTSLVVMDDAAFFMKNEVLLAGTVDELCELASPTPEAEIADGLKRFEEVRKVGQGKALGTFVAHPATQQRLREVAGALPEHASARMLALQGSGSRPRFLQRPVLAREIRAALEPLDYLAYTYPDDVEVEQLEAAHEASRERLDRLTGYIELRDRDLHKAATDVADSLRPLARIMEKKGSNDDDELDGKKSQACHAARLEYLRVLRELGVTAGDAAEYPLPELPKRD